jgi:hypothetical protein
MATRASIAATHPATERLPVLERVVSRKYFHAPLSARYDRVRARFEHCKEELEMKIFLTALSFVFFSSVVLPTTASAGIMDGKGNCSGGVCANKGVACPAGTCSKTGTSRARDIKNCSAKNCTGGPR